MLLKLTHNNGRPCLVNSEKIQFAQSFVDPNTDRTLTKVILKHVVPVKGMPIQKLGLDLNVSESFEEILASLEHEAENFIRLRKYNGRTDYLININQIDTVHRVWDKSSDQYSTKITLNGGNSFINVEDDLDTIYDKACGFVTYEEEPFSKTLLTY